MREKSRSRNLKSQQVQKKSEGDEIITSETGVGGWKQASPDGGGSSPAVNVRRSGCAPVKSPEIRRSQEQNGRSRRSTGFEGGRREAGGRLINVKIVIFFKHPFAIYFFN